MHRIKELLASLLAIAVGVVCAAPITPEQAKRAVNKWLVARPSAHMNAKLGSAPAPVPVETVADAGGNALFHVVRIADGGYVVTSADDGVLPIIAFSEGDDLVRDESNPLWVMLNDDLPRRMESVSKAPNSGLDAASSEWADLLSDDDSSGKDFGRSSIPDVRVDVLVGSRWSQSTAKNDYCYNYYTPGHSVCGCVATAGAQLIRFHEYPSSVRATTKICSYNGTSGSYSITAGTYNYSNMVLAPASASSLSTAQRQAIGKLCYDVGVSVNMSWTDNSSGAVTPYLADAFVGTFGYSNAKKKDNWSSTSPSNLTDAEMKRAIFANLDAGCPVILGIRGDGGHAIVADGYGYYSGTAYTHLNLGWAGSYDAWYALPDIGTPYNFNLVYRIVYNVFPQKTGELLTGRVTNSSGAPLSGVTVTARNGSSTVTGSTNAKGIYALWVTGGKTWSVTASSIGYGEASCSTYVATSTTSSIGNSWGNDMTLGTAVAKPNLYVSKCVLSSQETDYDEVVGQHEFAEGETIYFYTGFSNNGEGDARAPYIVRHELLNSRGNVIDGCLYEHEEDEDTPAGRTVYWEAQRFGFMQGLTEGSYTYRVTVDAGSVVDESSESDNVAMFAFTVQKSAAELDTVEISGPTSVASGARAAYTCRALLADGTEIDADCVWTIDSGSSYASINSSGVLSARVVSTRQSVVLRATCTYNGTVKSATMAVSIIAAKPIPVAIDNTSLAITTGGDAQWFGQADYNYDGVDAARSGDVGDNQTSWMETTVTGPGTISFAYLISSEQRWDFFRFKVDGAEVMSDSGDNLPLRIWRTFDEVIPAGTHTLRWVYEKDVSISVGEDAVFVDQVQWTPQVTPVTLSITVPSTLPAGAQTQLECRATMSDGSVRDVTGTCSWSMSSGDAFASVSSSGLFSAFASTVARSATVMASYSANGVEKTATATIAISAVIPLPDAPVIVSAGAGDANAANIRWSAAANAASYNVYRARSGEARAQIASGVAELSFSDVTALPGMSYDYSVSSVNVTGETFSDSELAYRVVSLVVTEYPTPVVYAGGSVTLSVKANTDWTANVVEPTADWLSVSTRSDALVVTVAHNPSEEARTAVVKVVAGASTDHQAAAEVTIQQGGYKAPGAPDIAFATIDGGDASLALYMTADESGPASRLLDFYEPTFLHYGWQNAGDGSASGSIRNEIVIRDSEGRYVYGADDTLDIDLEPGAKRSEMWSDEGLSDLLPGVYDACVTLNADGNIAEIDRENNEALFRFAVRDYVSLNEALDCDVLQFSSNGDDWYGTAGLGFDGEDVAMTKFLGDGGTNILSSGVSGAGTISFAYRVSSEANCDVFSFAIDGESRIVESGLGEWRTVNFSLGEGQHEFVWTYAKDRSGLDGDDCVYLDMVSWKPLRTDDPPSNFAATDGTYSGQVRLTWTESDEALSYVIDRAEGADGQWTTVYEGPWKRTTDDTTVLGGVEYRYRIKAVYSDGESIWSEPEVGWCAVRMASITSRTLHGSGGSDGIILGANCEWHVSSNVGWLRFDDDDGIGDGKIVYRFDANNTSAVREATITITGAPGGHSVIRSIKITQRIPVSLGTRVSLSEAADTSLAFWTTPDAPWVGQTRISHDGVDAMRSGEIAGNSTSRVETVVACGGTLSFWWGTCSEPGDKLNFYVAGELKKSISGYTNTSAGRTNVLNWTQSETFEIPSGGAAIAWEYVKDNSNDRGEDAGFVDQIVWIPVQRAVAGPDDAWWARYPGLLERLGLSDTPENRVVALQMKSPGDVGSSGKATTVFQDYTAGTSPLDSGDLFRVTISIENGVPVVSWDPQLPKEEARLRNYMIYGKKSLGELDWSPVAEGSEPDYNFFCVGVELK